MDFTSHYESPLGGITLASDGTLLTGLWFDGQNHFGSTLAAVHEEREALPVFDLARHWLDDYFGCKHNTDDIDANLTSELRHMLALRGSEFRRRVWQRLCEIPYGTTVTYGQIARDLGCRSAQAVGSAIAHNPISLIIPCHRVIAANGNLTGYAAGTPRKKWLLQHEQRRY